jgi:flagellin
MRINNNIAAIDAYRNYSQTNINLGKSAEKLSSGLRINRAADDAAGLVISQEMRAQISGMKQAVMNAQDGVSLAQTAEGDLQEVNDLLQRMRDLSVQSANGSYTQVARSATDAEFQSLRQQITQIGSFASFGTLNLFVTDASGISFQSPTGVAFMVGANTREAVSASWSGFYSNNATAALLFSAATVITIGTQALAMSMVDLLDLAIDSVSATRGQIGALQNRFESAVRTQNVAIENVTASESRLRDVDMAQEMTNFTKLQILQQSGTSMLAQANNLPQSVLKLLG